MNSLQGYLFPDYTPPLAAAQILARFRNEAEAQEVFLRSIVASAVAGGPGSTVVVGCSPVVPQELLAKDLLKRLSGTSATSADERPFSEHSLMFSAPPEVTSRRDQLKILHERYRIAADQLWFENMTFHCAGGRPVLIRSTEAEAVIDMLRTRAIKLVCVTHAENLAAPGNACGRILNHLCDIGRRSGVSHVLFGERIEMARMRKECRAQTLAVAQPLYNPGDKADCLKFASIVRSYDNILHGSADIVLATRTRSMMEHVGGDPCRVAQWLVAAVCQAAHEGATKLQWKHLWAAQPTRSEKNEAAIEQQKGKVWTEGKIDPPDAPGKPNQSDQTSTSHKKGKKNRRPGRKEVADGVPPAKAA